MIFPFNRFPYTNYNEINLDWIMKRLKEINPIDIQHPVSYDAQTPTPEEQQQARDNIGIVYPVTSVNTQTGDVVLTASDVGALADTYTPPVTSVAGKTGAVTLSASDVGALPDTYTAPVTSVNGFTGAVSLQAASIGALPIIKTTNASPDGVTYNLNAAPFWLIIGANSQHDENTGIWICYSGNDVVQQLAGTTTATLTMSGGVLTITTVTYSMAVWAIKLPDQ